MVGRRCKCEILMVRRYVGTSVRRYLSILTSDFNI